MPPTDVLSEALQEDLKRLATRFEEDQQPPDPADGPSATAGWGQFLDTKKDHRQVGLYGTASGVIVLALAGRGDSKPLTDACDLLRFWCENPDHDYSRDKLVQLFRISFLTLALRLSRLPAYRQTVANAESMIIGRLLTAKGWGNYFVDDHRKDESPRTQASAFALLCFSLLRAPTDGLPNDLLQVANELDQKLRSSRSLRTDEHALIAAALLALPGYSLSKQAYRRIRRHATARRINLAGADTYFYDYIVRSLPTEMPKPPEYKRDYLILSHDILLAIAGYQVQSPSSLRFRAEITVRELQENITAHNGICQTDIDQRLTTRDQVWCALLFASAMTSKTKPLRRGRLWYWLLRDRPTPWYGYIAAIFAVAVTAGWTAWGRQQSTTLGVIGAVATALVSAICGSPAVDKLFRER